METGARNLVIGIAFGPAAEITPLIDFITRSELDRQYRVSLAVVSEGASRPALLPLADRTGLSSSYPIELLQRQHGSDDLTILIDLAKKRDADLVVIQPGVTLFDNTLTEILTAAASDPMIGFVSPRMNEERLHKFPLPGTHENSARLYPEFVNRSRRIPQVTYAGRVDSLCFYARAEILQQFAADDISGSRSSDLMTELIIRSNRCGYRAATANWAFAYCSPTKPPAHTGSVAPRPDGAPRMMEKRLHPSPGDRAFVNIARLGSTLRPSIAFDFDQPDARSNGTTEFGARVIDAFAKLFQGKYDISVFCDASVAEYHGLDKISGLKLLSHASTEIHSAVLRLSQPFNTASLSRVFTKGAVAIVSMLDCIVYDCLDLAPPELHQLWSFVLNRSDAVIYISDFTKLQFARRFMLGGGGEHTVCMPSTDVSEFSPSPHTPTAGGDYLLIVGNHHAHKWIAETVRLLQRELPNERLNVLGIKTPEFPDVRSFESGSLSNAFVAELYSGAKAVVFPSHYEGFGFPIMHALGHRKVVYARDLPVYQEIAARVSVPHNIRIFTTDADLVEQLKVAAFKWQAPHRHVTDVGWDRTAREVEAVLARALASASWERIEARLAHLELLEAAHRTALARKEAENARSELAHSRNELTHSREETRHVQRELAAVLNSTSWKIMGFPRKLKEYLRNGHRPAK